MVYDIVIGRSAEDRKKLGTKGAVHIGKHYVKMGQVTSLSNDVYMDVTRSHVVFICGKRGSGKCVHGDTLISLGNGKEIKIKDLEKDDSEILALDKKLKIKKAAKSEFFKRKVDKIIRMKLRSGKEIKLTPEHPLLTIGGWMPVESLPVGSRIAVPRITTNFGEDDLPENQVKLIAYLIAEGHIAKSYILFSNKDKQIVEDFKKAVSDFDSSLEIKRNSDDSCFRIVDTSLRRKVHNCKRDSLGKFTKGSCFDKKCSLRKYLEELKIYGTMSLTKFIPPEIFRLPRSKLSLFLNRLFSCDGTIYYNNRTWKAGYSSSSKKLIFQVQSLLLKFGILSKIRNKEINGFKSFELELYGEQVYSFINEIGFFGEKQIKQKKALLEIPSFNPNVDTIPKEIWDLYRPENGVDSGRAMGYSTPKALRSSINYSPSRNKLLQIALVDQNAEMEKLACSDIFWDEIVRIEEITGEHTVYDLSVPENHNFVANGIIVHNSYTMGAIAEGIADLPEEINQNISVIMLDTMGIYWTMKYPNEKDKELLGQWGMKGRGLNVQIFTPYGYYDQLKKKGVPTDFPFSIQPSELTPSDWCLTFGIDINSSQGVFIDRIIHELMESIGNFSIEDIIKVIEKDEKVDQVTRDGAINRFLTAMGWGLFRKEGTKIEDLVKGGQITVLDVSCYAVTPGAEQLRALVIGLVSQKLFVQRMIERKEEEFKDIKARTEYLTEEAEKKKEMPMVWLVIDECLPYSSKVQTENGQKKIGDIVKEFSKGKKLNVIGYDSNTKKYGIYPVTKCYKRPQRQLLKFITETGQSITCTPDHKILSSRGFCEAQNSKDIALPLLMPYIEDKKPVEARLFGSILGDGWLSTNGKSIGFSGKGNNDDLEKIRCDLAYLGFKSSPIYSRKTKSKIHQSNGKIRGVKGTSHSITSSTKAYNHFRELGAPIGTKVLVPSKIPQWIMKGSKAIKCEFLAGLMGADGSIISRNINIPSDFNPIRFSFNKIKSLENNAFEFAEQLKKIYKDIGIKVSSIKKRSGNIRKDGNETIKIQITIAKSLDNVIVYLENIGYRYCEKKEIEGKKWLAYLKHRNYIIKERNKLRIKALKIHKEQGIGKIRIGRILGLPDYVIREWIYYNGKAGMPKKSLSFREWTKNRVSGENLFVKIINKIKSKEEIVYDLSVGKVHNFVADGFVVHNCHEFLPNKGKTTASPALITILREGRQPGICLILATQQPGKIHTDVMTQSDIVLAHRLTAKIDVDSLGMLMQSYMREGLDTQIDNLPRVKGAVIAFDDMNERMYPLKIRPRITWHGGEAPSAMPRKKEKKFGLG